MVFIHSVTTLDMPYQYKTQDVMGTIDRLWFSHLEEKTARLAKKLFEGAGIISRSSVVPVDIVFSDLSFEEKNDLYIEAMIGQGKKLLQKFFDTHDVKPEEIDYLITASCTGFMIPSVDAYLANHFNFRQDLIRLPITEMGCAGGTASMIYAHDLLQSKKKGKALIVSLEFPSLTFQKNDLSAENLVSTAIFADGAACVCLESDGDAARQNIPRLEIKGHRMYHFPEATHLMGFCLKNSGLKIVLHKDVPSAIAKHFDNIITPFLKQFELGVADIENFLFHPGGKKIIAQAQDYLGRFGKDIPLSHHVLTTRGNMSSATVLHILDAYLEQAIGQNKKTGKSMMLAFGPGFVAQQLLLEWT